MYGRPDNHMEIREKICNFIFENDEMFAPFVEVPISVFFATLFVQDDVPFDVYVAKMRKFGTWGGNIELQAMSILFGKTN